MRRTQPRLAVTILVVTSALHACQADIVGPDYDYDNPPIDVGGKSASSGGAASEDASGGAPSTGGVTPGAGGVSTATGGTTSGAGGASTATGGAAPSGGGGAPAPSGGACDLTGRWVITQRIGVEALGVRQAVRTWYYYEIAQSGDSFTVSRGLHCGYDVVPLVPLGANVDLRKSFPTLMARNPHAGRKGTSKTESGGCAVAFERVYSIDGATAAFYSANPKTPLPTPEQQASGSTPGWEDFDGDGKPGSTYTITGLVNGKIHVAARTENLWSGSAPSVARSFVISSKGNLEQGLLGYEGSELLASTYVKTNDPALQIVELARLGDDQATGDDAAACTATRTLVNTLTPKGNEKPL